MIFLLPNSAEMRTISPLLSYINKSIWFMGYTDIITVQSMEKLFYIQKLV